MELTPIFFEIKLKRFNKNRFYKQKGSIFMRKEIQEWIEKGNRTEAVRLLEEWVGKHPADEEEWLLLGELLYADGKMTEALNKFNTVLRLNPDHRKAANYVIMINNILGYYCKDMFNP